MVIQLFSLQHFEQLPTRFYLNTYYFDNAKDSCGRRLSQKGTKPFGSFVNYAHTLVDKIQRGVFKENFAKRNMEDFRRR